MLEENRKEERVKRLFSIVLFLSWISFMAFAGFFIPSFLTQIPLFKVKEISVKGNQNIKFEFIKSTIADLSSDLRNLTEENVKSALNKEFGGRVKSVFITKDLSVKGITLKLSIVERVPVAKIRIGNYYAVIDREGVMFPPLEGELDNLVEVKTYDISILKEHFTKLSDNILNLKLPIRKVHIRKDKIVLIAPHKTVLLPPLELLPPNVSGRLKMIYNLPEEKVDLRYDRFILVRN